MINKLRNAATLMMAFWLAGCGSDPDAAQVPLQPAPVATIVVAAASGYDQSSSYTGRVEAVLDSSLGFEVGGLLADVAVDEGDRVERGQTLAVLDTARLAARRAEAAARVDQVRADLKLAEATLARTDYAYSFKGVSKQQLDEAERSVQALKAGELVAQAQLKRIDIDLDKARITAPFDGVVIQRFADPGQVLGAGQAMLQLQSSGAPEIRIGVSPEAAAGMTVGDAYPLMVNDLSVAARLKAIIPRRDPRSRTVDALFTLDRELTQVRPGDLARLEIATWIPQPGFWVPLAALTEGPRGLWQGLVAQPAKDGGGDYTLVNRTVEVLHADSERAFVKGTIATGDLLVSDGVHRVVAGQRVAVNHAEPQSRVAEAARGSSQ